MPEHRKTHVKCGQMVVRLMAGVSDLNMIDDQVPSFIEINDLERL
jgi:hypothetical protein